MAVKPKNNVYLVQVGSELKSFDNWPACQAFVSGKPYKFAGGSTRAEALAKIQGGAPAKSFAAKGPGMKAPFRAKGADRAADKPKNNIYLVEIAPGEIKSFDKWPACKAFVTDQPYPYAGGVDREGAMEKLMATREKQLAMRGKQPGAKTSKTARGPRPTEGLTSDAGTHGNPGPCEYQVSDISGKILAHKHLGVHTNNYAELAGIEGMIHEAAKLGETLLWTDSKIAMGWIKTKRLGPTVKEPELIMELIGRINVLLREHRGMKLVKWETRHWGEIPSDFGRK